jgi:hypothetical protein
VTVRVLHENPEWLPPFAAAFDAEGVEWAPVPVLGGPLDLGGPPDPGVYWSRLSASAHTRGHGDTAEHGRALLDHLAAYGRTVVNGRAVLELELSKTRQLTLLAAAGIDVPRTIAVFGTDGVLDAARAIGFPVIVKPNRGGKGLGVARFDSAEELEAALPGREAPVDGVLLVQEYVRPALPRITRAELVGGELVYAITADTARGGFELCPAEACAVDDTPLFALRPDPPAALVTAYEAFAAAHDIGVAGFEFLEAADGRVVTYDVNTNTNYNPDIEAVAPRPAARAVARFLKGKG